MDSAVVDPAVAEWLALVKHDLVKRLLWTARDRRELGGPVAPGELVVALNDDEGAAISPEGLWSKLRADAPAALPRPALDDFEASVSRAASAAASGDLGGVLALEPAFATLARIVGSAAQKDR